MNSQDQMAVTRAVAGALVIAGFFIQGNVGLLVMALGALLAAFNIGRRFQLWHSQREGGSADER